MWAQGNNLAKNNLNLGIVAPGIGGPYNDFNVGCSTPGIR